MVYCLIVYESINFFLNMLMFGREVIIFLDLMFEMLIEMKDILVY